MRLLRFKLGVSFRSLPKGFEVVFGEPNQLQSVDTFAPHVLAGRNGSGKSNILEALANIFYHLDCMFANNLPDRFLFDKEENPEGFDNARCTVDAFELEYWIPTPTYLHNSITGDQQPRELTEVLGHVKVFKHVGSKPAVVYHWEKDYTKLNKSTIQQLLPRYVVGYSSGENELLSLPFFKTRFRHYDEYVDAVMASTGYSMQTALEGRLVYLDSSFSQAILLTNLLMQEKAVLQPLLDTVGLAAVSEFRLIIRQDLVATLGQIVSRFAEDPWDEDSPRLLEALEASLEKLKKCATCHDAYEVGTEEFYEGIVDPDNEEEAREYLVLDYWVNEATRKAFRFHFNHNPLELFQLFQVLLALDAYVVRQEDKERVYRTQNIFINHDIFPVPLEEDRILRVKNMYVGKQGVADPLFTKQLSDGEHQYLHTLGLCLLFRNERTLFLLDEPETHFNPDWKARYVSSIYQCFKNNPLVGQCDMLITTHSPYLISDSEREYVYVFERTGHENVASYRKPDFQTLGTSVNKITVRIFEKANTVGDYARSRYAAYEQQLHEDGHTPESLDTLLKEVDRRLGDSVEKVLLVNAIMDRMEAMQ